MNLIISILLKFSFKLNYFFLKVNSFKRRFVLINIDIFLIFLSFIIWIKLENINYENQYILISSGIFFTELIYILSSQYKGLTKYFNTKAVFEIFIRNLFSISILMILGVTLNLFKYDLASILLLCFIITSVISFARLCMRYLLLNSRRESLLKLPKVAIYGAG